MFPFAQTDARGRRRVVVREAEKFLMSENDPSVLPIILEHLRPLKWNERVLYRDYVADGRQGFKLWEGPGGFRADTFVRQTYRRLARRPAETKKES